MGNNTGASTLFSLAMQDAQADDLVAAIVILDRAIDHEEYSGASQTLEQVMVAIARALIEQVGEARMVLRLNGTGQFSDERIIAIVEKPMQVLSR